jgi:hypothetical protein
MISAEMRDFVDVVLEQRSIGEAEVQRLVRDLLVDGAMNHETIDVLLALDRAVLAQHPNWAEFLVATTVDHVVWSSRPTGVVTRDLAQWLVATLTVGEGPTENGMRIAFEVVREADRCDELLITFAMGKAGLKARQDFSRSDAALLVA